MAVEPRSVTATCCQTPTVSGADVFTCCSPAPVVMANRRPPVVDGRDVRNMYDDVELPKSKILCQVAIESGFTQAAIVKSFRPLTMPAGNEAKPPVNFTALPRVPGTNEVDPVREAVLPLPVASARVEPVVSSASSRVSASRTTSVVSLVTTLAVASAIVTRSV